MAFQMLFNTLEQTHHLRFRMLAVLLGVGVFWLCKMLSDRIRSHDVNRGTGVFALGVLLAIAIALGPLIAVQYGEYGYAVTYSILPLPHWMTAAVLLGVVAVLWTLYLSYLDIRFYFARETN